MVTDGDGGEASEPGKRKEKTKQSKTSPLGLSLQHLAGPQRPLTLTSPGQLSVSIRPLTSPALVLCV